MEGTKVKLTEVNPHLVCVLCHGYFVDATTIAECLHSFCRSCIFCHLQSKSFCPICEVQVHNTKLYLSLKPDKTLQDIVYKLVPGLFHNEMRRRREFYKNYPHRDEHLEAECRGVGLDRLIYSPEDMISLSLEFHDSTQEEQEWSNNGNPKPVLETSSETKRYLQCPAGFKMAHLKKFLRQKYNLPPTSQVEITYRREVLSDSLSLMDVAYIYTWKRNGPMRFFYTISKEGADKTESTPAPQPPLTPTIPISKRASSVRRKIQNEIKNEEPVAIPQAIPEPEKKENQEKKEEETPAAPEEATPNGATTPPRALSKQDEISVSALLSLGACKSLKTDKVDEKPPSEPKPPPPPPPPINGLKVETAKKLTNGRMNNLKMSVNRIATELAEAKKSLNGLNGIKKPGQNGTKEPQLAKTELPCKKLEEQTIPEAPQPSGITVTKEQDKPEIVLNTSSGSLIITAQTDSKTESRPSPKMVPQKNLSGKRLNGHSIVITSEPKVNGIHQSNNNNRLPTFGKTWGKERKSNGHVNGKIGVPTLDQRIQLLYNSQGGGMKSGTMPILKVPTANQPQKKTEPTKSESRLANWLNNRFPPPVNNLKPCAPTKTPEPLKVLPQNVDKKLEPPMTPPTSKSPTEENTPPRNGEDTTKKEELKPAKMDNMAQKQITIGQVSKEVTMLKRKLEELRNNPSCEITHENPSPDDVKRRRDITPDVSIELMRGVDVKKEFTINNKDQMGGSSVKVQSGKDKKLQRPVPGLKAIQDVDIKRKMEEQSGGCKKLKLTTKTEGTPDKPEPGALDLSKSSSPEGKSIMRDLTVAAAAALKPRPQAVGVIPWFMPSRPMLHPQFLPTGK